MFAGHYILWIDRECSCCSVILKKQGQLRVEKTDTDYKRGT